MTGNYELKSTLPLLSHLLSGRLITGTEVKLKQAPVTVLHGTSPVWHVQEAVGDMCLETGRGLEIYAQASSALCEGCELEEITQKEVVDGDARGPRPELQHGGKGVRRKKSTKGRRRTQRLQGLGGCFQESHRRHHLR